MSDDEHHDGIATIRKRHESRARWISGVGFIALASTLAIIALYAIYLT